MLDLSSFPVIDAHCHPFPPEQSEITAQMLLDALTVSQHRHASPENESKLLTRMLVRQLSRLLDCKPTLESVDAERNQRASKDATAYNATLIDDANIRLMMIDPGFPSGASITLERFEAVVPCPVVEGYRIERFQTNGGRTFPTG